VILLIKKGCPEEYPITLHLNNNEIATFQLTNNDLEDWAYGYLFSEGFITTKSDISHIQLDQEKGIIKVELEKGFDSDVFFDKKKHYTAGCGRGVTFFSMTDVKGFNKAETYFQISKQFLLKKIHEFSLSCQMYLETGGMHGACILHKDGDIIVREDIGRHNAVDKVIGYAVRNNLDPKGLILLTTGRISYEMLSKAAKFGFSVVGSRTAATMQAVQLARVLNIEVIGYIRGRMSTIYTDFNRVVD
jgi:FdhD protein